jgi:hypothetical protein
MYPGVRFLIGFLDPFDPFKLYRNQSCCDRLFTSSKEQYSTVSESDHHIALVENLEMQVDMTGSYCF